MRCQREKICKIPNLIFHRIFTPPNVQRRSTTPANLGADLVLLENLVALINRPNRPSLPHPVRTA